MRLSVAAALLLFAGTMPVTAQRTLPYRFAVNKDVSIRVWVPAGSVRIETWDFDSVRVSGLIGKNSQFFGGGGGESAKVGVEPMNAKDTVFARADLVVTVPRKARVWVKMTNGVVAATGTRGELEVITVAGNVTVMEAEGVVSVETIDATVTLDKIRAAVRVRGGSSKVSLTDIIGTLSAQTVSGAIALTGEMLQDATLATVGGGITLRGSVSPKAFLDLETHSGAIALVLPRNAFPVLMLTARGGTVTNPFSIKGTYGQINAHSFKGDINVSMLPDIEKRKP